MMEKSYVNEITDIALELIGDDVHLILTRGSGRTRVSLAEPLLGKLLTEFERIEDEILSDTEAIVRDMRR